MATDYGKLIDDMKLKNAELPPSMKAATDGMMNHLSGWELDVAKMLWGESLYPEMIQWTKDWGATWPEQIDGTIIPAIDRLIAKILSIPPLPSPGATTAPPVTGTTTSRVTVVNVGGDRITQNIADPVSFYLAQAIVQDTKRSRWNSVMGVT
jgi:hypothetical protein